MENAIELKNVCKRYGSFALQDVSFAVPEGCIVGLVGENGAGKSTLIRMMLGACRLDSGEISVLGERAGMSSAFTKVKQEIGVVLDEACLPDELNVPQTAGFMAGIFRGWDQALFDSYVNRFALPMDKPVKQFSRGTKMKLAIACALSHGARLLVLDEATGGLDPVVRDDVLDVLNEYTREEGRSVLMSSHIVSDLEKICDYIVFVHEGKILLCEEKDELLEKYAVLRLSQKEYEALDARCVLRVKKSCGSVSALVLRSELRGEYKAEHVGIEEIMLLLTKGEARA